MLLKCKILLENWIRSSVLFGLGMGRQMEQFLELADLSGTGLGEKATGMREVHFVLFSASSNGNAGQDCVSFPARIAVPLKPPIFISIFRLIIRYSGTPIFRFPDFSALQPFGPFSPSPLSSPHVSQNRRTQYF
jgi:hypothetical protein